MKAFFFAHVILLVAFSKQNAQAQYVTIPDANFVTWLQNNGYFACMNGSQLDASCPEVLNTTYLACINANISDLTGIQAFVNLTSLLCANNQLSTLPPLPNSLIGLGCHINQFSTLPDLPESLLSLDCHDNQLTVLPTLPPTLTHLTCDHNLLSTLPSLPNSLQYLACHDNQIDSLPILPASLTDLKCNSNQLAMLPALPNSLTYLNCSYNQQTYLPTLPSSLKNLYCQFNQLNTLPLLPDSLNGLNCANNLLTTISSLPSELYLLRLDNNTSLSCLPPLQKILGDQFFHFSIENSGISCLPNVIQHPNASSFPAIDTVPVCDLVNVNGCDVGWNILGKVFNDDGDCSLDSTEQPILNLKVRLLQNGSLIQQVFTNSNGLYSFGNSVGIYSLNLDTANSPFSVLCPFTNEYFINLVANPFNDSVDFGLECKTGYDVGVQGIVAVSGGFFPDNNADVDVQVGDMASFYGTFCNTSDLSGSVSALVTGPVSITSVSGNGLVSGNTITWNVSDFSQVDFNNDFNITFLTDTTAQAGEQVCVDVTVTANSPNNDNNPLNNTLTHCFTVVNSYDPNVKVVYPNTWQQAGGWHTYTIHFQNTGTAPAQHIVVKDTLDSNLDWSSFQLLAYSHDNLTQVKDHVVLLNFPNINLADSTTNEPESHGFVQYKIKTKSDLTVGTTIHNTAAIYFDFNDPVITNDALVTFSTSVPTVPQFDFTLSPNPANQTVVVSLPKIENDALVTVTELTGRGIFERTLGDHLQTQLSLDGLAAGTYLVQLSLGDKTVATKKLVVVK